MFLFVHLQARTKHGYMKQCLLVCPPLGKMASPETMFSDLSTFEKHGREFLQKSFLIFPKPNGSLINGYLFFLQAVSQDILAFFPPLEIR